MAAGVVTVAALLGIVALTSGGDSTRDWAAVAEDPPPDPPRKLAEARLRQEERVIERTLGRTPYVDSGGRGPKRVALTFDDGPGNETRQILNLLHRAGAKATFFSLGGAAKESPKAVRRIVLSGNALGNHSYGHPRLASLSGGEQREEIEVANNVLRGPGLAKPRMFRPPYGSFDDATLDVLRDNRMLMVLWSIDATDFGPGLDSREIAKRVMSQIKRGSIVLMHDGGGDRTATVGAVRILLRKLDRAGYEAVTVPSLLRSNPPPRNLPPPRALDGMP